MTDDRPVGRARGGQTRRPSGGRFLLAGSTLVGGAALAGALLIAVLAGSERPSPSPSVSGSPSPSPSPVASASASE